MGNSTLMETFQLTRKPYNNLTTDCGLGIRSHMANIRGKIYKDHIFRIYDGLVFGWAQS